MQELYVLPSATVAYWDRESIERAHDLGLKAVDAGEVEEIGRAYVAAISNQGTVVRGRARTR
jgi:hypothetical protein